MKGSSAGNTIDLHVQLPLEQRHEVRRTAEAVRTDLHELANRLVHVSVQIDDLLLRLAATRTFSDEGLGHALLVSHLRSEAVAEGAFTEDLLDLVANPGRDLTTGGPWFAHAPTLLGRLVPHLPGISTRSRFRLGQLAD